MMGVEYDLFWKLNPKSLTPFIKAFSLKTIQEDRLAWVTGLYIQRAISSSLNAKAKYPDRPFMDKPKNVKTEMTSLEIKEKMLERMKLINGIIGKGE